MNTTTLRETSKILRDYLESSECVVDGFDVPDSIWGPFVEAVEAEESPWIPVEDKMPDDRIRVIAADSVSVIGDCFFGYASGEYLWNEAAKARFPVERWNERVWRNSRDETPCVFQPTVWMPLPEVPRRANKT